MFPPPNCNKLEVDLVNTVFDTVLVCFFEIFGLLDDIQSTSSLTKSIKFAFIIEYVL